MSYLSFEKNLTSRRTLTSYLLPLISGLNSKKSRRLLILFFAILCLGVISVPKTSFGWWNSNWQNREKITFSGATTTGSLSNFPVLVNLNSSRIDYSKTSPSSLTSGLVGWWKMDEGSGVTSTDSSGSNNTGTINGATWTTGKMSGALSFDGSSYVDVGNGSTLNFERTNPFSISAWVYRNNNTAWDTIISKVNNGGNFQEWILEGVGSVDRMYAQLRGTSGDYIWAETDPGSFSTLAWHHVVMTYDGSSTAGGLHIYIDGVDKTTSSGGTLASSILNSQTVLIGKDPSGGGALWNGKQDDVRIYNRALSQTEIQQLANPAGDLRFIDPNDSTQLPYEVENWNPSGTSTIWVKANHVSSTQNDYMYMYYNNSSATSTASSTQVWDSWFKGVWHLGDGTTLNRNDSTSGAHTDSSGTANATSSIISGGASFNPAPGGTDAIYGSGFDVATTTYTMSLWVKPSSTNGSVMAVMNRGGKNDYNNDEGIIIYNGLVYAYGYNYSGVLSGTGVSISPNVWSYISMTRTWNTSSSVNFYINGKKVAPFGVAYIGLVSGGNPIVLGSAAINTGLGGFFAGAEDDARYSWIDRSTAWSEAEYKNGVDTYNTYGTQEAAPAVTESVGWVRQDCTGYSPCYTSLSAWQSAYGGINFGACSTGDLVCANQIAVAKIDGAWTSPDTTGVTFSGWTTDAAHYIKIYTTPSARHNGKWNTNKYRIQVGNDSGISIDIGAEFTRIDGLQIWETTSTLTYTRAGINALPTASASAGMFFSNNLIRGTSDSGAYSLTGIRQECQGPGAGAGFFKTWNNIVYDFFGSNGYGIETNNAGTHYIYNNTVYNSGAGITRNYGTLIAKNNIAYNNTTDYSGTFNSASTNNLSKDGTAPTYGKYYTTTTVKFIDSANSDFHLSIDDNQARGKGISLAKDSNLSFTTDIDGQTRSGTTWDIGADQAQNSSLGVTPIKTTGSGLVGYWSFNEGKGTKVIDTSGNKNNGTLINGTSSPWVNGKLGKALMFNGTNDYVVINSTTSLNNLVAKSISVWLYITAYAPGPQHTLIVYKDNGYGPGWLMFLYYDMVNFYDMSAGYMAREISNSIPLRKWTHVVITCDGSATATNTHIYLNGVEGTYNRTQNGSGGSGDDSANPVYISMNTFPGSSNYTGAMDDLRIYNKVLSATEIQNLYQLGAPVTIKSAPSNGLVGYWPMNEGKGTVATDMSGNKNNGTLSGTTLPTWVNGKLGKALSFDGASGRVSYGNMTTLDGSAYATWSFWTKLNVLGTGQAFLSRYNRNDSGTDSWTIINDNNGGGDEVYVYIGYNVGQVRTNSDVLTVGKWIHVVVVYDGTQLTNQTKIKIYINGVNKTAYDQGTVPTTLPTITYTNYIGAEGYDANAATFLNGSMDDVRVYNRALSANEIQSLYLSGLTTPR